MSATVSVERPGPPDTTAPFRPDERPANVTAAVAVHASLHATDIRTPTASRRSRSCVLDSAIDSFGAVLSSGTVPAAARPVSGWSLPMKKFVACVACPFVRSMRKRFCRFCSPLRTA